MSHVTSTALNLIARVPNAGSPAPNQVDRSPPTGERLDQFYTQRPIAAHCYGRVCERYDPALIQMVEPSAGTGAFSDIMPRDRIAIDKDPKGLNIIRGDYLATHILSQRPIAVVGNPPFGKNSSAAKDFFKHAARNADVIGFILPRTACKGSFVRSLPLYMHLVYEEVIPDYAFLAGSQVRSVPTIFQIWERRCTLRVMPAARTTHPHFEFTDRNSATFEIQRIGMYAGRIRHGSGAEAPSLLFIKAHRPGVEEVMSQIDFSDCIQNNAGNPCVSMEEIVMLYSDMLVGRSGRFKRPLAPLPPDVTQACLCCSEGWPFR